MLRDGQPNPLNVHGLREVEHCPPHFERVLFELKSSNKAITDWIWENLEGRFWFGNIYYVNESNDNIEMTHCAAFELAGEASMFALCLSQINSYEYLSA